MDSQSGALINFIKQQLIRSAAVEITETTPLVSSGLVDSLSLPQLLLQLEKITGTRISIGKVSPQNFETVQTMLETAKRIGVPKP